jgi:Spy/CpxP family protein refolding chaperone
MNTDSNHPVAPAMKSFLAAAFLALAISSCAGAPGHFNGGQKGPQRRGSGNAQLEGPTARDVIRDVHYDRGRQNYEDRRERRY